MILFENSARAPSQYSPLFLHSPLPIGASSIQHTFSWSSKDHRLLMLLCPCSRWAISRYQILASLSLDIIELDSVVAARWHKER